jgi:predicted lactoylglutathione lyase
VNLGWFETSLDVKDIRASITFYTKLGFQFRGRGRGAHGHAQSRRLPAEFVSRPSQSTACASIKAISIRPKSSSTSGKALAAQVKVQGVEFFSEPLRDEKGAAFMLKDPDGHVLYFINLHDVVRSAPARAD